MYMKAKEEYHDDMKVAASSWNMGTGLRGDSFWRQRWPR
jgi:hypothetical protein